MDNSSLVSIIVPVYQAERYIEDTISSVLAQTYHEWELLLVDDHSADRSAEICEQIAAAHPDARIRVLTNAGKGAASARNTGLAAAAGRYIAFLDADDQWRPEKLAHTLEYMERSGAGFVFTGYEFADEACHGTGTIVRVPETLSYRQALANTTIFTSTVILDTEKINRNLIKMPQIKSEDTATWWQILRSGVTAYGLDENLVLYRRAGKSLSSNKLEALRRIWNLYRNEGLSVPASCRYFIGWAVRAVKRRV